MSTVHNCLDWGLETLLSELELATVEHLRDHNSGGVPRDVGWVSYNLRTHHACYRRTLGVSGTLMMLHLCLQPRRPDMCPHCNTWRGGRG